MSSADAPSAAVRTMTPALLHVERLEDVAQPRALVVLQPARDAEALTARHVDDEAAGERHLGRQPCALRLHRVLDRLDEDRLAAAQQVLDALAVVPFALELGDDDLVDVEEAVLLEADVDERGLHPGQHVVDGAQVDVPGDRAPVRALEVDLGDLAVLEDGDAALGDAGRDEQLALRGRERRPLGLLAAPAARPSRAVLLLATLARGLLARWLLLGLPGRLAGRRLGALHLGGRRGRLALAVAAPARAAAARPLRLSVGRGLFGRLGLGLGWCVSRWGRLRQCLLLFLFLLLASSEPVEWQTESPSRVRARGQPRRCGRRVRCKTSMRHKPSALPTPRVASGSFCPRGLDGTSLVAGVRWSFRG